MAKLKIFVARRWDPKEEAVNGRIIKLIEHAGMEVTKGMDKTTLENIELKEAMNIIDADAFCVIITPRDESDIVTQNVRHEINTAKTYGIPSFVFVDKIHMGYGVLHTTV